MTWCACLSESKLVSFLQQVRSELVELQSGKGGVTAIAAGFSSAKMATNRRDLAKVEDLRHGVVAFEDLVHGDASTEALRSVDGVTGRDEVPNGLHVDTLVVPSEGEGPVAIRHGGENFGQIFPPLLAGLRRVEGGVLQDANKDCLRHGVVRSLELSVLVVLAKLAFRKLVHGIASFGKEINLGCRHEFVLLVLLEFCLDVSGVGREFFIVSPVFGTRNEAALLRSGHPNCVVFVDFCSAGRSTGAVLRGGFFDQALDRRRRRLFGGCFGKGFTGGHG